MRNTSRPRPSFLPNRPSGARVDGEEHGYKVLDVERKKKHFFIKRAPGGNGGGVIQNSLRDEHRCGLHNKHESNRRFRFFFLSDVNFLRSLRHLLIGSKTLVILLLDGVKSRFFFLNYRLKMLSITNVTRG